MRAILFAMAVAGLSLSPVAMAASTMCDGNGGCDGKKKGGDSSLVQMGEGCGGCCPGKKGDDKK